VFFFNRGLNNYFPDETSQKFQNSMYDLSSKYGITSSGHSSSSSPFNRLVQDEPDILDEIIPVWLSYLLYDGDKEVSAEDVQELEKLVQAKPIPSPVRHLERNRILTILPYLSAVEEGGETVFPRAPGPSLFGTLNAERTGMDACGKGVHVPPKKGSAAMFYHLQPNGHRDEFSTHGGCPPVKGVKYAINIFCWNLPYTEGVKYFR